MIREIIKTVLRKFVDIIQLSNWQVKTDNGFVDIKTINKTIPYIKYKLQTLNGKTLVCADNHIIIRDDNSLIFAKDSLYKNILTTNGIDKVILVKKHKSITNMYDLELDDDSKHLYYTNGILSHNTTTYTIYALWTTMFHAEKKILLLANKSDTALEILGRIRMAYEYIPKFLKPGALVWNKGEVVFTNRSSIKGFATASDAARGASANIVIADEFSFVPNNIASKVFESIYPVISSSKNSLFIIVSTPNGADSKNLYYELWCKANSKNAEKNTEGWKAFRFDWWDVPGRNEQWKANTIASIGEQRFAQEFGNEFLSLSSIKKLIPSDIIEKYRVKLSELKALDRELTIGKRQNIFSEKGDKLYEFTMWHEFKRDHTYLASGDCSEGVGGDSSVIYVWDVTDLGNIMLCAMFASNTVSPIEFAFITSRILAVYNNPYYICERNGIGSGYLDSLAITYKYPNIVTEGKNGESGVFSHTTTKEKACVWSREMMTTLGFGWTIYDKQLLDEFDTFVKKDTKSARNVYAAINPAHDDRVMTWIWCTWLLLPELVEKYFICCKTFTSQLEKVYPLILMPTNEYTEELIQKVSNDPFYQKFMEFKDDMLNKLGKAIYAEKVELKNDAYVLIGKLQKRDEYFGDYDIGGTWNEYDNYRFDFNENGLRYPNRPPLDGNPILSLRNSPFYVI